MRITIAQRLERIDWWMMGSVLGLNGFGLVIIHSLTWPQDARFARQMAFLFIGLLIFAIVQFLDINFWRNASLVLYALVVVFLLGLIFFADQTRGSKGWFMIGTFGFQASEFAKISVILFLATTLEKLKFDLARFRHIILVIIIIGIPVFLTIIQPDIGSAFIILISSIIMVLYTGLDKKKLVALSLIGILILFTAWFSLLHDYQKTRILTFLNPSQDPLGSGYNVAQSIVAIGSGGVFGRGLGLGPQSQLNFLPEQETDFIFASIAEELGFIGSSALILLYIFFLWRLYIALISGKGLFANFFILGIMIMFFAQAGINIGMNMGLFPVTGITLPFVSYGGSSLAASFLGLGIASVCLTRNKF